MKSDDMTPDKTSLRWRKSSLSGGGGAQCVELSNTSLVRDSKNPTGPTLRIAVPSLLAAIKDGRIGH
jgi:uncharacterized protein DUF397